MSGVGKAIVIMNMQHILFAEQQALLNANFSGYEIMLVPMDGWTKQEMDERADTLLCTEHDIVFLSPVPYLLMSISKRVEQEKSTRRVYLFHRDVRYKAVDPNSKRGCVPWMLVH